MTAPGIVWILGASENWSCHYGTLTVGRPPRLTQILHKCSGYEMHLRFDPAAAAGEQIEFEDFLKVDIRVGEIVEARVFEKARKPAYILVIDFGKGIGRKKSSAQVTDIYEPQHLVGRQIAAVVNFPPRQIGPLMSEVLVLGFADENGHVVLFQPDRRVPNGSRLH